MVTFQKLSNMIKKYSKEDYTDGKSYRMLTILNIIAKLYDSIYSSRLSTWLELIKFDQDQYAYRKYTSCNHAVFSLVQDILEGFNQNKVTIGLFIDLEGAFDAVWHQGIIYQMHQEGISGNFLKITWNILNNRKALCKVNSAEREIICDKTGICQGSESAAPLFTFHIRKIMANISSRKIKYSDDGNAYLTGKVENLNEMARILSNDLQNIINWCHKWRMPVSYPKQNT